MLCELIVYQHTRKDLPIIIQISRGQPTHNLSILVYTLHLRSHQLNLLTDTSEEIDGILFVISGDDQRIARMTSILKGKTTLSREEGLNIPDINCKWSLLTMCLIQACTLMLLLEPLWQNLIIYMALVFFSET